MQRIIQNELGTREMSFTISSMIIGIGILTLPRALSTATESVDGWISIVLAGCAVAICAWALSRIAVNMGNFNLLEFTSLAVGKPVAYCLQAALLCHFILYAAFETRAIANIAKLYLFEITPIEFIALTFLLVVTYAATGSRIGVLRLNVLFLPLVFVVALVIVTVSSRFFELSNFKPVFVTPWTGILKGAREAIFSLTGFEVILFYVHYMTRPQLAVRAALIGIAIPVILYVCIYLACIGVFSHEAAKELTFPTIELAMESHIPGEFFERFESVFFIIWIMTIFNTTAMAVDIAAYLVTALVSNANKKTVVFLLNPIIYLAAMFPRHMVHFHVMSQIISFTGIVFAVLCPILIGLIAKVRGVRVQ